MPLTSALARQRSGRAIIAQRTQPPGMVDVPAPITGWNARDSLAQMEPTDARTLDNLFPGFGRVTLRKGFQSHATGVGSGAVDTVLTYRAGATEKLIACSQTNIYDATGAGAASSLLGSQTSGRWQGVMMNQKLLMVNGADTPVEIDSTPTAGTLTISGVTGSTLSGVTVHKNRSYFWTGTNQIFWYSAVNAAGGALTSFDLSRVGTFGGALVQCLTWTRDGGAGPDDYFVALMSSGEAIVYAGSDPGSASDWFLVGVYKIGEPIGIRSATKVAGDVVIATKSGYQSLINAATSTKGRVDNKIVDAVTNQIAITGENFGWQALLYERGNQLIFNYPESSSGQYGQHVVNIETGAWCRYTGQNGSSWTIFGGKPYFGTSGGIVMQADVGQSDNGVAQNWEYVSAWNYLGDRSRKKHLGMVRPVITTDNAITFQMDVAVDFRDHKPTSGDLTVGTGEQGTAWDTAEWDTFMWGGATESVNAPWIIRENVGFNFSLRLKAETLNAEVALDSVSYAFRPGALL